MNAEIMNAAMRLARENKEAEPAIIRIYISPAEDEIRLIEIDPSTIKSDDEHLLPFFFAPDLEGGIPYRSAIALIREEEFKKLRLPQEWASWDEVKQIWPQVD